MKMVGAPTKQKALCVATRCTTAEQFVETFHRYCDEQSFFVATMNMRPVGLETPFSIQLADKTPVLRGLCVVLAAYTTAANPYKRPGVRLGIRRLTSDSEAVFYQLQAMRTSAPLEVVTEASASAVRPLPVTPPKPPMRVPDIPVRATPPPVPAPKPQPEPVPEPIQDSVTITDAPPIADPTPARTSLRFTTPPPMPVAPPPPREEERTPGSDLVLPANPLQNLTDESLEGFVDCTLYEETGNFFRAPETPASPNDEAASDEPAPPPVDAMPQLRPSVVMQALDAAHASPTIPPPIASATIPPPFAAAPPQDPSVFQRVERVENSVVQSLARVEHSVSRLLDVVDTSRPIDEDLPRATPLPAGEAYARQVAKQQQKSRGKLLLFAGGAAFAVLLAIVLVIVARSSSADETKPSHPSPPIAASEKPVVKTPEKPATDVPKAPDEVDGDEVAATENEPGTPAAGEGPCKLEVKTTPAGTMVSLDGQAVGPSPITINGPCTKRRVDLAHPRYKDEMRWISLAEGKPGSIDVALVRPTHNLTIVSNPAGATVFIAGRRAGTTPTKISLMGFTGLDVKVEKFGFVSMTKRVYSKRPNDSLSFALKKQPFMK
jgi:hypothetical protein